MQIHVLVIDDELSVRDLVQDSLPAEEFTVYGAPDTESGLRSLEQSRPDVLLLDLGLPDCTGQWLCRLIRSAFRDKRLPIIILTADGRSTSKVSSLEDGADDYITKPFEPMEMAARIKAVLRRSGSAVPAQRRIHSGCLDIDGQSYSVRVQGRTIPITIAEFEILYLLAANEHQPLTRNTLLRYVCPLRIEDPHTIETHIFHLRQKLGPVAGNYIKTLHRIGYMFAS